MPFRKEDAWQGSTMDILRQWLLTALVILALLVLSVFPFNFANIGEIRPSFMLMAVYYWAIMRPSTLPPVATFLVGLAFDLLANMPLGLNAMTLVIAQWATSTQRKVLLGQSFVVVWMGLGLVALGSGVFQWLLKSLFDEQFDIGSLRPMLVSVFMTAAVFPLIVLPLSAFNKALAER